MVLGIGFAGIIFTHKVAGPIFKMKRLLREIGEGKLVLRERLRKGDELQHFFETFEKMVNDLRHNQEVEIAKVDEIIVRLDASPASPEEGDAEDRGIEMLRRLRREDAEPARTLVRGLGSALSPRRGELGTGPPVPDSTRADCDAEPPRA